MNDTLDFAKIEQGLLQLCCEPFSGAAFLSELAATWARPAAELGVSFAVRTAPEQPAAGALLRARALRGDLLRLQQITNKCVACTHARSHRCTHDDAARTRNERHNGR
jgi:signal transduction histidine kinase